jgi:hypothetical protein
MEETLEDRRGQYIAGAMEKSGCFFRRNKVGPPWNIIYWKPDMSDVVPVTEDNFNEIMLKEGILPWPDELAG